MIKAILFDAFGTLFDTGNGSIEATKQIFKNFKINKSYDDIYSEWKTIHKNITHDFSKFRSEEEIFTIGLKKLYKKYCINSNPFDDVNGPLEFGINAVRLNRKKEIYNFYKLKPYVILNNLNNIHKLEILK